MENLQTSGGWVHRFERRRKEVDGSVVSDGMADTPPALLSEYEAQGVFNANEAGLFFFNLQVATPQKHVKVDKTVSKE